MPEMKHQFTGGKMNKDLDERMVPNGEYRDGLNIEVSTSEGSDVGTVQNILGNSKIQITSSDLVLEEALVIGAVSDEKNDTVYWLVWSPNADYIISFKRNDKWADIVFADVNKSVLNFTPTHLVTGINILDGMLFWTDNNTEPKKINIERCRQGTSQTLPLSNTLLINDLNPPPTGTLVQEKHITVIKKTPTTPLGMELISTRDPNKNYTGVINTALDLGTGINTSNFINATINGQNFSVNTNNAPYNFSAFSIGDTFTIAIPNLIDGAGNINLLPGNLSSPTSGLGGWIGTGGQGLNLLGATAVFAPFIDGDPPGIPVTSFSIKAVVIDTFFQALKFEIVSIDGFPPLPVSPDTELQFAVDLFEEEENLFEFKFPRFSYRHKYEDGEYSPFAPFTQVAFTPGSFDYHPRKGYNIGMTNRLREVRLSRFVHVETPKDVVSIDLLFKDEKSATIYVVDTISPDDDSLLNADNVWETVLQGGYYSITKETVNAALPSNQLLRPWDNVPRKALAQEITGNRVVYANYIQNYNLRSPNGVDKYNLNFNLDTLDDGFGVGLTQTSKSIKSLREYQLGVVFTDKYGRETPVISNPTGTIKVPKEKADKRNRFSVDFKNQGIPSSITHFKFFVKETSTEYYNMAMDRWYDAEDGNVWLAFPSSDRNKIDIDTFLILKKGADDYELVEEEARYKVLAIESEAPDFIKTSKLRVSKRTNTNQGNGDLFPIGDEPFPGESDFKLNYEAYVNTSGQALHLIEDDLYIEFRSINTGQASDIYRVSQLSTNYEGGPATATDKYSIQLDKPLSDDVNFITNDPTGANMNSIESGVILIIYKYKVENKPQFDGRFFVKIYSDNIFKENIQVIEDVDPTYRVISHRKLFSMNGKFIKQHTIHPTNNAKYNRYLVDGINDGIFEGSGAFSGSNERAIRNRGYYLNDCFSANAQYFRRYQKEYTTGNPSTFGILGSTGTIDLVNLKNLQKSGNTGSAIEYKTTTGVEYWKVNPDWIHEYGDSSLPVSTDTGGYTANFVRDTSSDSDQWFEGYGNWPNVQKADTPQMAKETEVWFVDAGPHVATRWNDAMTFGGHNFSDDSYNDYLNIAETSTNPQVVDPNQGDIYDYLQYPSHGGGSTHFIRIGYGGISGYDQDDLSRGSVPYGMEDYDQSVTYINSNPSIAAGSNNGGFFNVGDWDPNNPANINYNGTDITKFTDNFGGGFQFRFREDPLGTIYTIQNVSQTKQIIRHSPRVENLIAKKSGNTPGNTDTDYDGDDSIINNPATQWSQNSADNSSMAELLSFNFSKQWRITAESALTWNPFDIGQIQGGYVIDLTISTGGGTSTTSNPAGLQEELIIFVDSLSGANSGSGPSNFILQAGMALSHYTASGSLGYDTVANHLEAPSIGTPNDFLVVRHIETVPATNNTDLYYKLYLSGYTGPFTKDLEHRMATNADSVPADGGTYRFVQVGMNGYSPNSEFNINTMGSQETDMWGKIGAVGYHLEFVAIDEEDVELSDNPAIWETEPKEDQGLEIYYEATGAVPARVDAENIQDAIPQGSIIMAGGTSFTVINYFNQDLIVTSTSFTGFPTALNQSYQVIRPDGLEMNITVIAVGGQNNNKVTIKPSIFRSKFKLPWHNCYSFGNGVESNRIRDNFNQSFISNGVKASTTLEQEYKEERRQHGLIYSGIYNSISGMNNTNQFIQAEKITKDINPIYGSIQKLYSRSTADGDLITLCEDRILKILANKDALFNADGNSNVTSTDNVLGYATPYSGNYGISTNPESFASQSYRCYFTDKVRGSVLRLSKDGLTQISDFGMKDWFRDNLKLSNFLHGSHDDKKAQFNIAISNNVPFEGIVRIKGATKNLSSPDWEPMKELIVPQSVLLGLFPSFPSTGDTVTGIGIPSGTVTTSFLNLGGGFWRVMISNFPNIAGLGAYVGYGPINQNTGFTPYVTWSTSLYNISTNKEIDNTLSWSEQVKGWVSFKSFKPEKGISMANDYYTFSNGDMFIHHDEDVDRCNFYGEQYPSSVTAILNKEPGSVKEFKTVNYEGSQSKINKFEVANLNNVPFQPQITYNDQEYYNLYDKQGWFVQSITTDKEDGFVDELLEKEGKWYNYIKRNINLELDKADTADFSFQGIGFPANVSNEGTPGSEIQGCTDPNATNYNPQATIDDGSCIINPLSSI